MLARTLVAQTGHDLHGGALDQLDHQLAVAIAEARARWPGILDHDDAFVEALASRVESEAVLSDAIARLALADVYLVTACLRGDRVALDGFERLVRAETVR